MQRTTPVALEYCSRQPCLPQPQVAVSWRFTVMWPISPPAPWEPSMTLPFTMTPPPTPVPRVTMTALRQPLAAPIQISPRAATLASLPTSTFRPSSRPESWADTLRWPQPPRLAQTMGTTLLSSTGPGTPMPTPSTCSAGMAFSCILPMMAAARFSRMCSPALEVSVGTSHFSSRAPAVVNRPILAVVPPRSMPNAYSFIISFTPLLQPGGCRILLTSSITQRSAKKQSRSSFSCNQTEILHRIWTVLQQISAPCWSDCRCRRSRSAPCRPAAGTAADPCPCPHRRGCRWR